MLPIGKIFPKDEPKQYIGQTNKDQNQWVYQRVVQNEDFDDLDSGHYELIAISKDDSVLFAAVQITYGQKIRKRMLQFFDIVDKKLVQSQISETKFHFSSYSISTCLFMKDSQNLIIGWENWEIQQWKRKKNGVWYLKLIINEELGTQYDDLIPLDTLIINKAENLLIASAQGLNFWNKSLENDCTWNYIENNQIDLQIKQISYNETERYLIGQERSDFGVDFIIILEQFPNIRWVLRRKIAFDENLNELLNLPNIFLRDDFLIYNNSYVFWNKWSGKLIQKNKFHEIDNIISTVCNINNKIIVLTDKESMNIYRLEHNKLILQNKLQISSEKQTTQDQKLIVISYDCRFIFKFREEEKIIYERTLE